MFTAMVVLGVLLAWLGWQLRDFSRWLVDEADMVPAMACVLRVYAGMPIAIGFGAAYFVLEWWLAMRDIRRACARGVVLPGTRATPIQPGLGEPIAPDTGEVVELDGPTQPGRTWLGWVIMVAYFAVPGATAMWCAQLVDEWLPPYLLMGAMFGAALFIPTIAATWSRATIITGVLYVHSPLRTAEHRLAEAEMVDARLLLAFRLIGVRSLAHEGRMTCFLGFAHTVDVLRSHIEHQAERERERLEASDAGEAAV